MRTLGLFVDNKRFSRGFSRSGEFTISEAQMLEKYGRTMQGLLDGSLTPESDQEKAFIEAFTSDSQTKDSFVTCWRKYLSKTQRKRTYTLCSSTKGAASNDDEDDEPVDLDDEDALIAE